MLLATHVNLFNNCFSLRIDYSSKVIQIKDKICSLAKEGFGYLVREQGALSVTVWTSLFIQVGVNASSMIFPEPINNLETCVDRFCAYSNLTHPDYYLFSTEICCDWETRRRISFFSLEDCMNNLGVLYSSYINANWNNVCASTELKTSVKKVNKYMAKCFEKLCSQANPIRFIDENILDWCPFNEIKKSERTLRAIAKKVTRRKTNQWTKEDILQVSADLFIDLSNNAQSMLASIVSAERFGTLTPKIHKDLNLIKKGLKEMLSSPIELIKGLMNDQSAKDLPLRVRKALLNILNKMDNSLSMEYLDVI